MEATEATKKDRLSVGMWAALIILGCFVLFLIPPGGKSIYPVCYFHALTGLYCPTCGGTRPMYHLLHGHSAKAFANNPLFVILIPPLLFLGFNEVRYALTGKKWRIPQPKIGWTWFLLALLILFGILRNIPVYPFTLLVPPP